MDNASTILGDETQKSRFTEHSAFDDKHRIFSTLRIAHSEIVSLRAQVDRLKPKAEAYDVIARMWRDQGNGERYASVDTVYDLREMVGRMEREFYEEQRAQKQAAYEAGDAREVFDADHDEEIRSRHPTNRMARGTTAAADLSGAGFQISDVDREAGT